MFFTDCLHTVFMSLLFTGCPIVQWTLTILVYSAIYHVTDRQVCWSVLLFCLLTGLR